MATEGYNDTPEGTWGCWTTTPLKPPWPGATTACGYAENDRDLRCVGCLRSKAYEADKRLDEAVKRTAEKWGGAMSPEELEEINETLSVGLGHQGVRLP